MTRGLNVKKYEYNQTHKSVCVRACICVRRSETARSHRVAITIEILR